MNDLLRNLKKYFAETPESEIKKAWDQTADFDKCGPTIGEYLNDNWITLGDCGLFQDSEIVLDTTTWTKHFRSSVDKDSKYIPYPNCDEILQVLPRIISGVEEDHEIDIEHVRGGWFVGYEYFFKNEVRYIFASTLQEALGGLVIELLVHGYQNELKLDEK